MDERLAAAEDAHQIIDAARTNLECRIHGDYGYHYIQEVFKHMDLAQEYICRYVRFLEEDINAGKSGTQGAAQHSEESE